MTTQSYRKLEDALIAQGRRVSSSKAAATQLINELGIRHLLTSASSDAPKAFAKKAAPKKKSTAK